MNKILLVYLAILLLSCSNHKDSIPNSSKQPIPKPSNISLNANKNPAISGKTNIPQGIDNNFETFLKYFNHDSIFQVSRIDFPIKVKVADAENNFEISEKVIQKQQFRKLDFTYNESNAIDYKQTIEVNGNNATIELRGIENGIMADFYFEKKNGKWKLVTWEDSST